MRHSTAFDLIHDPADPAWVGHALEARPRRWAPAWIVAAAAGSVVAVLVAVALVVLRDEPAASARASSADDAGARTVLPSAIATTGAPLEGDEPVPGADADADAAAALTPPAPVAPTSGWAPEAATKPSYDTRWVGGDTAGVAPAVTSRLEAVARQLGRRIDVVSGWRTTHEQADLYRRYRAGTGNLAAVPGTSLHESGRAADVYVDGVALANVSGATSAAAAVGLHFPVGGEPWHVELVGDSRS